MRSTLFLALVLGSATARRSPAAATTTTAIGPSPRILDLGQPYYPFGWGLDDSYFGVPEEFQIHDEGNEVKKIKEVKRSGESDRVYIVCRTMCSHLWNRRES